MDVVQDLQLRTPQSLRRKRLLIAGVKQVQRSAGQAAHEQQLTNTLRPALLGPSIAADLHRLRQAVGSSAACNATGLPSDDRHEARMVWGVFDPFATSSEQIAACM
ncbi:MAG: hypothetical protein AB7W59_01245 [Acidimicrobiia bacterium]